LTSKEWVHEDLNRYASVLALTISSADAAARQPRRAPFEEAFFVAMLVGEPDQVIAANGPLEFSVRCVMSGAATRIQLLMQSSVDDWSATWVGPNLLAGEVLFAQATNTIDPAFEAPGGQMVRPPWRQTAPCSRLRPTP
jgi:hypothetical protein